MEICSFIKIAIVNYTLFHIIFVIKLPIGLRKLPIERNAIYKNVLANTLVSIG